MVKLGAGVRRSRTVYVVAAQTALALVTCLLFLGRKNFWLDESYSFIAAHRPAGDLMRLVTHDESNMSPYYIALHVWLHLGRSEAAIRLLSVIPAVLTVPVFFSLVLRLRGQRAAVVAGFLAAGNLMLVAYAQEARSYSLVLLLVTCAGWLFVDLVSRPRPAVAVAWTVVSALAVYAHYFAALVVLAQLLSLLLLPPQQRPKFIRAAVAALVVLLAPLAVFALRRGASPLDTAQHASVLAPVRLVYRFSGSIPLAAIMLLLCGYAAVRTAQTLRAAGRRRGTQAWTALLPWIWLLLPIVLALGGALVRPLWKDRYLIVSLPAFLLLVASALADIEQRAVRNAVAGAVAVLMVVALSGYYTGRVKQDADWRAASAYATARTGPQGTLWFLPATGYVPFAYYAWKRGEAPPPDAALDAGSLRGRIHPKTVAVSVLTTRLRESGSVCAVLLAPTDAQRRTTLRRQLRTVSATLVGFRPVSKHDFGRLLTVRCYLRGG